MQAADDLSDTKLALADGAGAMPAFGFGTLTPDRLETQRATTAALDIGFRHFDCAERDRNEDAVGRAIRSAIAAGTVRRQPLATGSRHHRSLSHPHTLRFSTRRGARSAR